MMNNYGTQTEIVCRILSAQTTENQYLIYVSRCTNSILVNISKNVYATHCFSHHL